MSDPGAGGIRVGIGGWTYDAWRGTFYPAGLPAKSELGHASRKLTSIEVNGTFYRSQTPEIFAKWREETPDGFVFALKGPRFVVNRREIGEAGEAVERFFASGVMALKEKLGPVNWQFMPTRSFDPDAFAAFLACLPKSVEGRAVRHAVEVRHESFRSPDLVALAREHGVAIVVAGDCAHPQIADAAAPFVYVRIQGTSEGEPAGYSAGALDRWAERARIWAAGGTPDDVEIVGAASTRSRPRDVFLYVINGFKARNPAAAMALIDRLR